MYRNLRNIKQILYSIQRIFCVLVCVLVLCTSCQWHEAKVVIATADSIDQKQHVIWDDTAALGQTIRQLDNPFGRLFMRSTLGKAYYYMGRNHSLSNNIKEAAECYIEADRLHIDDPLYRGRVNSCMGYICRQNNNDSLALIFYERSSKEFKKSGNEWYYAQSLLNISENYISLHQFSIADSILQMASLYQLDSSYMARYHETKGLYFYEQQQYDSALVYFNNGLCLWNTENDKCFSYMKMMQIYSINNMLFFALPYAEKLLRFTNSSGFLVNAYYCMMQYATIQNNTADLSVYASLRADSQNLLRQNMKKVAEAILLLECYLDNPYPLRWVWVSLVSFLLVSGLLVFLLMSYRKRTSDELHLYEQKMTDLSVRLTESELLLTQHKYDADLAKILKKYPTPPNRWNEYSQLKKELDPYLHDWLLALDQVRLTNREKVFCVFAFIYRHVTIVKIADHMNNVERAVRVLKTRVVQKLGITSAELIEYLQNLHTSK